MKQITTLSDLKKQDIIMYGYKPKRFKFGEQFKFYSKRSKQEKEDYARFWKWAIKEGIVFACYFFALMCCTCEHFINIM